MKKGSMHFALRASALLLIFLPSLLGQGAVLGGQRTNGGGPVLPPMPPPPISFRQLFAMSATERETILATRSPEQRQILQQKLREYDSLPPAERASPPTCLQLRRHLR